jgi:acyl-CoA synthetase (AMP-forming)/AMP-acid ligase II
VTWHHIPEELSLQQYLCENLKSRTEQTFSKRICFALQATMLYLVPPLIQLMGSSPDIKSSHFESVNTINNGAAPVGPNDVERLLKKAPNVRFSQGTLCQLPVLNKLNVL